MNGKRQRLAVAGSLTAAARSAVGGAAALVLVLLVLAVGLVPGTVLAQAPMGDTPAMPGVIAGPVTPTPSAPQAPMGGGAMALMHGHGMMQNGHIMGCMMGRGMMGRGMMGRGMMGRSMMGRSMTGCSMGGTMGRGMLMPQGSMAGSAGANGAAAAAPALGAIATPPEGFAAALAAADSAHGQQLALANGCLGCHTLDAGPVSVGPRWQGLAVTAASRVLGQKAEDYLYTSIVQPNAYIVPGYPPNVMVQTYGQTLGADELTDIVKYLLTLQE